ncbi:MAG: hypothetical protein AAGF66_19900 [Cyanobacteria bacterium P01_H01_bin.119]
MSGRLAYPGLLLLLAGILGPAAAGYAAEFPPCAPPSASEYLLLVRGESQDERDRIQGLLPASSTVMVCDYLDDVVVRAGGFTDLETANAWAQYMSDVESYQAFVARPPVAEPAPPPSEAVPDNSPETAVNSAAYNPQPLTSTYAVLVDYFNQPEVAFDLQQSIEQPIGLVVYRQRPYLLVSQTTDVASAGETLQMLSDQNFTAVLVDGRQVVVLTPQVAFENQSAENQSAEN